MYNEVLVVEGKNDKARILAIFPNLEIVTTNGSEISNETLDMLEELSKINKIILFLDPDYPGERIRSKILQRIPTCENVFIEKKKAIDNIKRKVGVEHASNADLKEALQHRISYRVNDNNLTTSDLYSLGLLGKDDSTLKRIYLAQKLHIGNPNGKTLLKRLNFLQMTYEKVSEILNEKDWNYK
jgi:ribonuclease M5